MSQSLYQQWKEEKGAKLSFGQWLRLQGESVSNEIMKELEALATRVEHLEMTVDDAHERLNHVHERIDQVHARVDGLTAPDE